MGRPHGLQGFIGIYVDDSDLIHLQPGSSVFLGSSPHTVKAIRRTDKGHQVLFEGIDDRMSAEMIRGRPVSTESRRALQPGEYWREDLVGLDAIRRDGSKLGIVSDVAFGPAQDRLVIQTPDGPREVPFVDAIVPEVDPESGYLMIEEIPGLLDQPG